MKACHGSVTVVESFTNPLTHPRMVLRTPRKWVCPRGEGLNSPPPNLRGTEQHRHLGDLAIMQCAPESAHPGNVTQLVGISQRGKQHHYLLANGDAHAQVARQMCLGVLRR